MAVTLAFLLHLPPAQAVVKMFNDVNGTSFRLDRFAVSTPTVVEGLTTTQVTLTSINISPEIDDQVTVGSANFMYERLDLSVFLATVLANYHPSLPCSTQTVLNEITARIDQAFYGDDILLQEITRDNGVSYALTAKPASLRFVGSIVLPLIQVTNISTLYNPNLIAGSTDHSALAVNLDNAVAYVNGTDFMPQISTNISINDTVETKPFLLTTIQGTVADPASGLFTAPWYVSSTPGPYNLYGSKVIYNGQPPYVGYVSYVDPASNALTNYTWPEAHNTAIPDLDSAVVIAINTLYCTNFSGTLSIPYSTRLFDRLPADASEQEPLVGDGFVAEPRLIWNSAISLSNGTDWNKYLNSLSGDIYSFQTTPPVMMDGDDAWSAIFGSLSKTGLYASTIVYNGQLRAEDLPAATAGLDRVMVVDLTGSTNSVWTGTYPFYYQSPIPMSDTALTSTVGSQYQEGFVPNGGTGPFTNALVSGDLPPGLAFNGNLLEGIATDEGTYAYTISITDGTGYVVLFNITHTVKSQISTLELTGALPPATENSDGWVGFLDIVGGLAPYTLAPIIGDLPASITADLQYNAIEFSGTWVDNAVHHFTVSISSADGQMATRSFSIQAQGTELGVTASASLNGSTFTGVSFNGSYAVAGGQSPYAFAVTSGSFPPGLLLNGSTGGVTGTANTPGTYSWTVAVSSADGFAGSVDCTLTVVVATFANIIAQDNPIGYWPCDETSGTVLHDLSGNGHDGVIVTGPQVIVGAPAIRAGATASLSTTAAVPQAAYIDLSAVYPTNSFTSWSMEAVGVAIRSGTGFWGGLLTAGVGSGSGPGVPTIAARSDSGTWVARGGTDIYSGVPLTTVAHLLLTYDGVGQILTLYVNGTSVGSAVTTSIAAPGNVLRLLGDLNYPSSYSTIGSVSDVALYSTALSANRALSRAQFLGLAS